jgi:hypothetical protein
MSRPAAGCQQAHGVLSAEDRHPRGGDRASHTHCHECWAIACGYIARDRWCRGRRALRAPRHGEWPGARRWR